MRTKLVPANSDKALQAILDRKYNGLQYKTDEVILIKELQSFFIRNNIKPVKLHAYRNSFNITHMNDGYIITFWTHCQTWLGKGYQSEYYDSAEETIYSWKKVLNND